MNRNVEQDPPFHGELGQTSTSTVPITTDAGDVFRAEVYTTINATENPELRDQLVQGTLNQVEPPDSDQTYEPAVAVRYHDEDNRVFALVVPSTMRHRAFELRAELLDELAEEEASIPDYVADFATVFDPSQLEKLERTGTARTFEPSGSLPPPPVPSEEGGEPAPTPESGVSSRPSGRRTGPESSAAEFADLEEEWSEIEQEWERIETEHEELETREQQLEDVRDRIDRERRRMDEVEQELAEEREELQALRADLEAQRDELDAERQSLDAERLQMEERNLRSREESTEESEEVTQVVTDDQFISVSSQEPSDASGSIGAEASGEGTVEPVSREPSEPLDGEQEAGLESDRLFEVVVEPIELSGLPSEFDEAAADGTDGVVDIVDGRVVASARLPQSRLEPFCDEAPEFYVQHHDLDAYPLIVLLIASLDDQGQPIETYGWPLNVSAEAHRTVLNRLSEEMDVDIALYDESGELVEAYEVQGPLEENIEWIRTRVEDRLADPDSSLASFDRAVEQFQSEDFERLGSMLHSFDQDAFRELGTPSQVKLAAGVVGYWSTDEQYEYLISNRSYPLLLFRELQEDVVDAAIENGIFLNEPLRELAVEMGRVADDVELVERLLANFAEVSVQLRANDLEPMEEWENWDALIEFAQEVGVTPDPDVLELAEASLKRARDFQETRQENGSASDERDLEGSAQQFVEDPAAVDVTELVVSKRSESTGVTYFLPDDAVIDTFDDLADVPRDDLEKLLNDPNGRLEASQMLVERFDTEVVPRVLEAAEKMSAPEVTALARFFESKADGLEPELVRAVESAGPSATFVAARALAEIKSTSAIPTLLEAYRDPDRQLNRQAMARTLASYGDKLLPALTSSIKDEGVDERVVTLLHYLEEEQTGILETLGDDRSEDIQEAVHRARQREL